MRQLRYSVAASLDGFIAGPNGEFDWIPMDPEIDFAAMYDGYSALVMGRRSYEVSVAAAAAGVEGATWPPMPVYVYSRSLPPGERDGVTFAADAATHVSELKASGSGKPIWLWGGGELFAQLATAGLVDGVDVAVVPVMLGGGIPVLPAPAMLRLQLKSHRVYSTTGIVFLEYDVRRD